jgi:hypothetical protein
MIVKSELTYEDISDDDTLWFNISEQNYVTIINKDSVLILNKSVDNVEKSIFRANYCQHF